MIGEAAPTQNPVFPPGPNDNQNSYFYDVNHTKNTGYFTAPCNAFNVTVANKAIRLFNLAMQGVVLIDIFPFAVSYSTDFRNFLNDNDITENFWYRLPQSVGDRIAVLRNLVVHQQKLALIAPPLISHHIAEGINYGLWPVFGTSVRLGINILNPPIIPAGLPYPPFIANIPSGTTLTGLPPHIYILPLGSNPAFTIQVPTYACCAYSGSGQAPHELFIRNAFGLP